MAQLSPAMDNLLAAILILSICSSLLCCAHLLSNARKNMAKRGKRMVFYLCVSDIVGAFFWLLNIFTTAGCPYFGYLNLFGYNASAMWTCAIGLFLYLTIKGRALFPEEYFHIACWSPPFATVLAVGITGQIHDTNSISGCWLKSDDSRSAYFSAIQYFCFLWNGIFLCLNIKELQKLKIFTRPSTPIIPCTTSSISSATTSTTASSNMAYSNSTTATKGQRGMVLMLTCYLIYTIGPIAQAIVGDGYSPLVSYIAMYFGAAKGILNVIAINEGRLYGVLCSKWRRVSEWFKSWYIDYRRRYGAEYTDRPIPSEIPIEGIAVS